jgi:hypothetical protein
VKGDKYCLQNFGRDICCKVATWKVERERGRERERKREKLEEKIMICLR